MEVNSSRDKETNQRQGSLGVSVVITTYKRDWEMIERAVESVLHQSYPALEVLIVDDNTQPSPFSESIQRAAQGISKVRYIPMGQNGGVSAARNKGISLAQGDLIGFLDDDDEWLPDKLSKQVAFFEEEPDLGLVFGIGRKIYEETGKESLTWNHTIFKERPTHQEELENDHVGSTSHPLMRLSVVKELGGFRRENQPAVEDYELWIRISENHALRGIDEPLYIKHMEPGEHISTHKERTFLGFRNIYQVHKEEYLQNPRARLQILRNICREGIKARKIQVLPYVALWVGVKVGSFFHGSKKK